MVAEISSGLKYVLQKISECQLKRAQVVTKGSRVTHDSTLKTFLRVYIKVSKLKLNFGRLHAKLVELI